MAKVTSLLEKPFLPEGEPLTKDKLIEFIKDRESFRSKAYWDVDHYTIGYGTKASGPDEVISKKVAEKRLIDDINTREKFVRNFAKAKDYDWNDSQVYSLVDFHFNTKQSNFLKLTDYGKRSNDEIAKKLLEYNTVDGEHNQGIQNRRWQNHLAFTTPTETNSLQNFADNVVEQGNIDLTKRPVVKNKDGSISTVRSMSFNDGKNEVLIPTVSNDGRIMSDDEAIKNYYKSGEHLGKFGSVEAANSYADTLHKDQEKMYAPPPATQTASSQSVFANTQPIQVAANTPTNTATDAPTGYDIPLSITQKYSQPNTSVPSGSNIPLSTPQKYAQALGSTDITKQAPQTPFNTDFNDKIVEVLVQNKQQGLAKDYYNNISNMLTNKGLPSKEFNDQVVQGLVSINQKDLAKQYYNDMSSIYSNIPKQQQAPAPEAKPVEPVKEQSALRVLGQTALKEVIPTGIGYGVSEIVGAALAPETGGASLALVPLLVNLGARIGTFIGAHAGGSALQKNVLPEAVNKTLEQGEAQHPTAAFVGGFLPFGLYGGFGLSKAARKEIDEAYKAYKAGDATKLKSLKTYSEPLVQAGFGAGIEGVSQAVQGEFDPSRIILSGLLMPVVSGDKTRLGKSLSFENIKLRPKESADDIIKRLKGSDFFIPTRVDDIPIVDLRKESKIDYSTRHGITEGEVDTHQQTRNADKDSIRIHETKTENKPTIEVNYEGVAKEFANKEWTKLYGLPENAFNDFQSYLDFKLQRVKTEFQEPKDVFKSKQVDPNLQEPEAQYATGWDDLKPGSRIKLYRGEGKGIDGIDNIKGGDWWTTNKEKAAKYGNVIEVDLPAEALKYAAAGHGLNDEFVFAGSKKPIELQTEFNAPKVDLDKEYQTYLNDTAMEQAAINPFYNLDSLGLPPTPTNEKELADAAFISANAKMVDHLKSTKLYEIATKKEGLTPEMQNNIRMHLEGVSSKPLSAEEQKFFDKYYKPLIDELTKGYEYLKTINPELAHQLGEMRDGKLFFSRMMNPLTLEQIRIMQKNGTIEDPNFFGKIKNTFAELGGKLEGGFDPDLGKLSSASKTRSFWVLERGSGAREVLQLAKDGKIWKWTDKEATLIGKMPPREQLLREGDSFLGGKLAQGSIEELEQHAPVTYNRNSLAVLLDKMEGVREEVRQDLFLRELMASPMMKDIALPTHVDGKLQEVPEGYAVPKNVQKYPPLAGYMFPTRVANIINDFARVWEPTVLTNLTNIIVKNMMVNPIAHMLNEAFHLFNARGLSGWVTPGGIMRFQKYGREAINDVVNLSDFYEETIRLGGALLAPGTRATALQEALFGKGLNEFSKTGEFKELANDLGVSLKQLYNGISKQSNRAMWITRDIMYMQYLREIMATKGVSHAEAIVYAEKHMPNYRLPSMIGEKVVGENIGRGLSYVMQNPNISVFSRYHYGMVKSLVNMVQEVGAIRKGAAGMKEFKQGVDSAAAVAVAIAVMYPLMDMAAKSLTDNEQAKFRRAGPYHLIHAMEDVTSGAKSPAAAMNSVFTFNPALSGLLQFGMNTNWYSGQAIYNPQSDPITLASDIARYAGMQLPMASQALRAGSDKTGQGYSAMAARQIDIESPTEAQYVSQEKRKREAAKDAIRRNIERHIRGF